MVKLAKKAVALVSGGLDSTLAVKLMLEQGVEVVGLYLSAPWGCCDKTKALKAAKELGIPFMVVKLTQEYIRVIRRPKYGYGSSMNPCVDCRIYMFHKARELMGEVGASFVVTGEVLAQRPMSQMRHSLRVIERDAGLDRLIVRPLSAKLLPATLPEEQGVIDREKMQDISGRSRKKQMELAIRFGIVDYPNPAGGCLLTDKEFGNRVRDLFEHQEEIDLEDMELLRLGRHFRLNGRTKLIVGRDERENATLKEYLRPGRQLYVAVEFPGPSVLLQGDQTDETRRFALALIARYSRSEKRPAGSGVSCFVGVSGAAPERVPLGPEVQDEVLERMKV
ncbi:MAG: hypothetical protein NC819_03955 [Candidatus Omnitrophica bacterium]|nr:hypothetical protein [Candidatus Omnitrophota bacterium]